MSIILQWLTIHYLNLTWLAHSITSDTSCIECDQCFSFINEACIKVMCVVSPFNLELVLWLISDSRWRTLHNSWLGCSTKCVAQRNTSQHTFHCILLKTWVAKWSPYNSCHGNNWCVWGRCMHFHALRCMYIKVWFSFKKQVWGNIQATNGISTCIPPMLVLTLMCLLV